VVDPEQFNVNVRSGQLIEVEGTAGPGDFAPEIDKSRVRILGETPLPVPRRVSGTSSPPAAKTANGWRWRPSSARRPNSELI